MRYLEQLGPGLLLESEGELDGAVQEIGHLLDVVFFH